MLPFETGMKAGDADLYIHNAQQPIDKPLSAGRRTGLAHRWQDLCRIYADVNQLFGDIVKVARPPRSRRRYGSLPPRQ